jgi:hypothetical protein
MSLRTSLPSSSARRNRQRGSVLVVAMVALVALAALGGLAVVTVRSSLSGTTHDQFKAVALSAAEAGVAVGIDFARRNLQPGRLWSDLVFEFNLPVPSDFLHPMPGNGVKPGESGYIFSSGWTGWYTVEILNNRDDGPLRDDSGVFSYVGFLQGDDTDGRIIIRSTGFGPNNASVRLEVEIQTPTVMGAACNSGLGNNDGGGCGMVPDVAPPAPTPL